MDALSSPAADQVVSPVGSDRLALAFADARAPRYTSYPTAAQFTAQVDEASHRQWLGETPEDAPISLYLHVPFCRRLCWYCGCNMPVVNGPGPVTDYVRMLGREMTLVAEALDARRAVSSLHLGGGSPDTLTARDLDVLFADLRRHFDVAADAEIAAELDPSLLTPNGGGGRPPRLTRASLGVQDFSAKVQPAINRRQSVDVVARCVTQLRAAGFGSINFDLMYGLPHHSLADVLATVDHTVALRPERVAVFGYAHVPWMKPHQKLIDLAALPGAAERLDQSEMAAERLVAAGYKRIGLDHFALPGDALAKLAAERRLRRIFQGYTADQADTLVGLDASSISRFAGALTQNLTSVTEWRARISEGRLATARGVAVTDDDAWRAEAISALMCDGEVDIYALRRRRRIVPGAFDTVRGRLAVFEAEDLIGRGCGRVWLTPAGRPLMRTVCTAFDSYFEPKAIRHAMTV